MMNLTLLSSKGYPPDRQDYGDCILVDNGSSLLVFDCGSEAHAKRVETVMKERRLETAVGVLSHNDDDHFQGFPYLAERGLLSMLYTPLFLQHLDELLKLLDDGRRTREGLKRCIKETYDNVTDLAENYHVKLVDALEASTLMEGVKIVGPSKSYALEAAAKGINGNESDSKDGETFVNAASVQVSCRCGMEQVLLCGDSSFPAIEGVLADHSVIQLPHHGKLDTAEEIFKAKEKQNSVVYLVSDNKGTAAGGSDELMRKYSKGRNIQNTRNGDVAYPALSRKLSGGYTGHTLGINWW